MSPGAFSAFFVGLNPIQSNYTKITGSTLLLRHSSGQFSIHLPFLGFGGGNSV